MFPDLLLVPTFLEGPESWMENVVEKTVKNHVKHVKTIKQNEDETNTICRGLMSASRGLQQCRKVLESNLDQEAADAMLSIFFMFNKILSKRRHVIGALFLRHVP